MANKLIGEQSPYLLQHAHNPVDWYPWGDEAFERAKRENKPVLVSIGYAACHWCHVMERESFENEATAGYMNEHFINIKVDREEHPDVDHLYMDAVQAISQQGGWPLNVFVTPDRVPFYGGTYYPPQPLYGRPSWLQVLQRMHEVWTNQQGEIESQTEQMLNYLKQLSVVAMGRADEWGESTCRTVADNMLAAADKEYGGFGNAPKFPAATVILYLLEHYHYTGYQPALDQAIRSLDAMAEGGIYDQLGGGFARYSTDKYWLAPHFEKMLYDNALLIVSYAAGYAVTGKQLYRTVVEETITFVNRELRSPDGGFYCALDADSEGEEGKFYTWTWDEWLAVTGGDGLAEKYFGIEKQGNWEGTNILHVSESLDKLAKEFSLTEDKAEQHINNVKKRLLQARESRVRPATDDKCLLAWNALMNLALTKAGQLLGSSTYVEQAERHMSWMLESYLHEGRLMHTWKNGAAKIDAKLDDYAYLIAAMLQLAHASGDNSLVVKASAFADITEREFLHDDKTFFYYSSVQQTDIPVRKTDLYDGSTPSANSIMAANLIWIGMLMESSARAEQGRYMLNSIQGNVIRYATSFSAWAIGGQRLAAGYTSIVIAGDGAAAVLKELDEEYVPNTLAITAKEGDVGVPLLTGKHSVGALKVYVCDVEACRLVTEDIGRVKQMLANKL
ncbi:MAG TPA: thioredoxin domain-containing protein [Flavipsychrobacter sp.]